MSAIALTLGSRLKAGTTKVWGSAIPAIKVNKRFKLPLAV
jgi:hypothetical protein